MTDVPIEIIPGASADPETWKDMVPLLGGGKVNIFDHTQMHSISTMRRTFLAMAPKRSLVIAHSMGGYVGLDAALHEPERLIGLVLVNTRADADTDEQKVNRWKSIEAGPEAFYAALDTQARYDRSLSPLNALNEAIRAKVRRADEATGFDCHVRHQFACMARKDSRLMLEHLQVPVLVISGEEDRMLSLPFQVQIAKHATDVRLRVIENCGHNPHFEQPKELARHIRDFIPYAQSRKPSPPRGWTVEDLINP